MEDLLILWEFWIPPDCMLVSFGFELWLEYTITQINCAALSSNSAISLCHQQMKCMSNFYTEIACHLIY